MKKQTDLLLVFLAIIFAVSVVFAFFKFFIFHTYQVQGESSCDPETEACFVYECDPETDDWCTGDPEEDTWYYKMVSKNASNIPVCDPNEEECEELACVPGELDCEETFCSESTLSLAGEGVYCSNPADFEMTEEEGMEEEGDSEEGSTGGEELSAEGEEIEESEGASMEAEQPAEPSPSPGSLEPAAPAALQ